MTFVQLKEWEEYSGVLKGFKFNECESSITLIFLCGDSMAFLFDGSFDYNLEEMKGRKIGILRTDLMKNEYLINCENNKK